MPREGYVTASQFSAAIGLNPYCSRQKCARLMLGLEVEEPNLATMRGNDQEWLAIARYEAISGNLVTGQQQWFDYQLLGGNNVSLGCHVDGITGENGEIVVEAKTPKDLDSFERNYAEPPSYYIPQVQGQMLLAGARACHFVANCDDLTRIWQIDANKEYQQKLVDLIDEFWGYVATGKQPPRGKKPVMPAVNIQRIFDGAIK